jgi:spermidine synthase
MSDTPAEYRDAVGFIRCASGAALISGLGLGMVVKALLAKPDVEHITVLELSPDVIKLVAPSYPDPRLRIIEADCRAWKPDRKFDWAWHDIWGDVTTDDLPEMATICRRFAKAMTAPGRQMVWGRELIRRHR